MTPKELAELIRFVEASWGWQKLSSDERHAADLFFHDFTKQQVLDAIWLYVNDMTVDTERKRFRPSFAEIRDRVLRNVEKPSYHALCAPTPEELEEERQRDMRRARLRMDQLVTKTRTLSGADRAPTAPSPPGPPSSAVQVDDQDRPTP